MAPCHRWLTQQPPAVYLPHLGTSQEAEHFPQDVLCLCFQKPLDPHNKTKQKQTQINTPAQRELRSQKQGSSKIGFNRTTLVLFLFNFLYIHCLKCRKKTLDTFKQNTSGICVDGFECLGLFFKHNLIQPFYYVYILQIALMCPRICLPGYPEFQLC